MSLFDKLSKLAGAKSSSRTIKYERSSTKVWVDGKAVESGVEHELVDALRRLGLSGSELDRVLGDQDAGEMLRSAAAELAEVSAQGPTVKVDCPACARNVVNRTGACMYCGAALVEEAADGIDAELVDEAKTGRHAVDEKFLESDATETSQDIEAATEDAYLRRLRRM